MENTNKMYGNVRNEDNDNKSLSANTPSVFRKGNVKLVMFTNNDTGISSFKVEKFYKPKPQQGQSQSDVDFKTTNYLNENDLYKLLACINKYYEVSVFTNNVDKIKNN